LYKSYHSLFINHIIYRLLKDDLNSVISCKFIRAGTGILGLKDGFVKLGTKNSICVEALWTWGQRYTQLSIFYLYFTRCRYGQSHCQIAKKIHFREHWTQNYYLERLFSREQDRAWTPRKEFIKMDSNLNVFIYAKGIFVSTNETHIRLRKECLSILRKWVT
jgi:hypothetical protein